jgi:hypothetical protein
MANVVISGDTSGAITLAAPAVAGTTTLTLPATTGTLVVTSGAQTIEFADGTVSAPSITNSGDTNTGIFFPAADTIAFSEGGAEAMRIDSSGNVGIGTSSPVERLTVANTATSDILSVYRTESSNGNFTGITFAQNNSSSAKVNYAAIYNVISSNTASSESGALSFYTRNSGTSAERMRITSSGLVGIGTSSPSALLQVAGSSIFQDSMQIFNNPTASAQGILFRNTFNVGGSIFSTGAATTNDFILWVGGSGTQGAITGNGAGINYSSNSDYRLKENVAPMTGALAKVSQLKPCTYIWKFDGSEGQGFIAHELQEVFPDAVTGKKDDVETYTDEDGNEQTKIKPQGVDTSFLVATLTAALQELKAIVDTQATKIAELEAKLEGTA